jgi:hypothetical protein
MDETVWGPLMASRLAHIEKNQKDLEEMVRPLHEGLSAYVQGLQKIHQLEKTQKDLLERIRVLEERDNSRIVNKNRSSALIREMTREDALKVLNGDYKDLNHREAATMLGLTYAQVYSCRMCYTFKPIHRLLEESGWRSPWKRRT